MGWGGRSYLDFLIQIKDKVSGNKTDFNFILLPQLAIGDEAEMDRDPSDTPIARQYASVLKAKQDGIITDFRQFKREGKFKFFNAKLSWDNLYVTLENIHDKTFAIKSWGFERQKRFLKEKILERCKKYNLSEIYLTEKTLGAFEVYPDDPQDLNFSRENPEIRIEFCKAIRALEVDGFLKTYGRIEVDLDVSLEEVSPDKHWLYVGQKRGATYYPAEHCQVKIKVLADKQMHSQPVGKVPYSSLEDRYQTLLREIRQNSPLQLKLQPGTVEKPKSSNISHKLSFYPDDGVAEYKTAVYTFSGKGRALLAFLNESKNTTFTLEDIKNYCNPNIANTRHQFRGDKDVRDTVNYIKNKLQVNKGEFFPIHKKDDKWIWLEK